MCKKFSGPTSQGMVKGPVCSLIMKTQGVSLETHLQKSNRVEQRIEGNLYRLSKKQTGLIHSHSSTPEVPKNNHYERRDLQYFHPQRGNINTTRFQLQVVLGNIK